MDILGFQLDADFENAQLPTRGIVYCRCSAGFKVFPLIKSSCNLIRNHFEIGNKPYRQRWH